MTEPVRPVFPLVPPAAAMVVDKDGRVRVYALRPGDEERLEDLAGSARWEGGSEEIEHACDMLRAVSSFRTTLSFRVTVRRPPKEQAAVPPAEHRLARVDVGRRRRAWCVCGADAWVWDWQRAVTWANLHRLRAARMSDGRP